MEMTNSKQGTKKMLVAFDMAEKTSSDFLVPVIQEGKFVLFGTKSKHNVPFGMVVFIGREITVNDVFARLVESGCKIPSVSDALSAIDDYLNQINGLKIGQVVEIAGDVEKKYFTLEPTNVSKSKSGKPLP